MTAMEPPTLSWLRWMVAITSSSEGSVSLQHAGQFAERGERLARAENLVDEAPDIARLARRLGDHHALRVHEEDAPAGIGGKRRQRVLQLPLQHLRGFGQRHRQRRLRQLAGDGRGDQRDAQLGAGLDVVARLVERHPAHDGERHHEEDDEDGDEALDVRLAVDEPGIGRVDEEPGMAGERRRVEAIGVRHAPKR